MQFLQDKGYPKPLLSYNFIYVYICYFVILYMQIFGGVSPFFFGLTEIREKNQKKVGGKRKERKSSLRNKQLQVAK